MALSLVLAGMLAGTALPASTAGRDVPDKLVFPIAGPASWTDDFGDPRAQGSHEGNDIVSERGVPVVAVEPGKIRIWNRSGGGAAGCMLYLYGKSGTTYLYIHLNNDLTDKNDNRGKCVPGVAFAPGLEDGQRVRAGELIAFVGDSGDANGYPHLHFELHPSDGGAVSPFRWLKRAERPLFAVSEEERLEAAAAAQTLTLTGELKSVEVVETEPEPEPTEPEAEETPPEEPPAETAPTTPPTAEDPGATPAPGTIPVIGAQRVQQSTQLRLHITRVELSTGEVFEVERDVVVTVPADAVVERKRNGKTKAAKLDTAEPGEAVTVITGQIQLGLKWQLARPGTLLAASILLRGATEE